MSLLDHIKGRSQCCHSVYCNEYRHRRTGHIYNAEKAIIGIEVFFILQLENKQQIMPNNVETQYKRMYSFIVCLFGVYRPTDMEKSPLPVKGCKFWPMPLSSEGSLACHTYFNTGHPFIMVISEDPWHSHLYCQTFSSGAFTTYFYDLSLSRLEFEHQPFACGANTLTDCATAAVACIRNLLVICVTHSLPTCMSRFTCMHRDITGTRQYMC